MISRLEVVVVWEGALVGSSTAGARANQLYCGKRCGGNATCGQGVASDALTSLCACLLRLKNCLRCRCWWYQAASTPAAILRQRCMACCAWIGGC